MSLKEFLKEKETSLANFDFQKIHGEFTSIPKIVFTHCLPYMGNEALRVFLAICYRVFDRQEIPAIKYSDFRKMTNLTLDKITFGLKELTTLNFIKIERAGLTMLYRPNLPSDDGCKEALEMHEKLNSFADAEEYFSQL